MCKMNLNTVKEWEKRTNYSGAKNKSDANQKSQIFQKSLLVQKQTIYHWKAL